MERNNWAASTQPASPQTAARSVTVADVKVTPPCAHVRASAAHKSARDPLVAPPSPPPSAPNSSATCRTTASTHRPWPQQAHGPPTRLQRSDRPRPGRHQAPLSATRCPPIPPPHPHPPVRSGRHSVLAPMAPAGSRPAHTPAEVRPTPTRPALGGAQRHALSPHSPPPPPPASAQRPSLRLGRRPRVPRLGRPVTPPRAAADDAKHRPRVGGSGRRKHPREPLPR